MFALTLVGCQTAHLAGVSTPGRWEGPNVYELPRFRWSPGRVVVMRAACTHDQGVQESVSRQTAVRKDASGLVEVVSEIDGKEYGRFYVNEAGRVVHVVVADDVKEILGDDPMARFGALGDWAFQPLERNRPFSFQLPMVRLLGPGVGEKIPGLDKVMVDGRFEYLGQTVFNGVHAAGYWMSLGARFRPEGAQVDLRGEGLSYSDTASGLALHYRWTLRMSMSAPGKPRETFQMDCRSTVDKSASSGL